MHVLPSGTGHGVRLKRHINSLRYGLSRLQVEIMVVVWTPISWLVIVRIPSNISSTHYEGDEVALREALLFWIESWRRLLIDIRSMV